MHFATPMTPPSGVLDLGDRRVLLDACVGRGSLASVHRGVLESAFGVLKPVACKIFGVVASEDRDHVLDALGNAVRRVSCVRHPNVVDVFEMGLATVERAPFILSELVQGATLRQLLDSTTRRGGRMPLDLALFVGIEAAEALSGARMAKGPDGLQLGVTHLDLGARDVLLSWHGEVKVKDFEISGARHGASSVRTVSSLAHRADTMAPEVARGGEGDPRSDVFSLGILVREMLIGPRFVRGTSDTEALRLARDGFVQPITFEPNLPEEVRRVLNRALEVEPERRYPHAGSMAYDLRRVALGLGVGDARVFLKAHLQKELAEERSDATQPHELEKKPRRRRRE
jgi:serine/threonine-protein kinase